MAALNSLAAIATTMGVDKLSDVVTFTREQLPSPTGTYLSLANVESDTGELLETSETASGTCFAYLPNDVLFARLRPYLNKVHRAESDGTCSTEFRVLRIADIKTLLPDYLAAILRSKIVLAQTVHMMTGNTHPRLTDDDVQNLAIPIPAPEVQQSIVVKLKVSREEVRRLRSEANTLLAGVANLVFDMLGIGVADDDSSQRAFAIRRGRLHGAEVSPSNHAPALQRLFNALSRAHAPTELLGNCAAINPLVDLSGMDLDDLVGFIPMAAVADNATGEYVVEVKPLNEVRSGYTPFSNGDILWAKITPCMQNGKICIVDGLPNGVGLGSTEFHVVRVHSQDVLPEFVREFLSQQKLRDIATYAFTGSAGQQRVPATFLSNLPLPCPPIHQQREIVNLIAKARADAASLIAEAEDGWRKANQWFEQQLLGPAVQ